ncbi:MAG: tRNA adenosine(34) deaminase TadA [Acidiferrobacteraceae bacterium]
MNDERFMRRAIDLAARAERAGEIPVGAVISYRGEIIGEGWNQSISCSDPTAHAEIVALRMAAANLKNYRITGATLYVTLEPCAMCAGALVHARILRLVFGTEDTLSGAAGSVFDIAHSPRLNHQVEVIPGVLRDECALQLRRFFRARRDAIRSLAP